jgi:ankyrin repeat protein
MPDPVRSVDSPLKLPARANLKHLKNEAKERLKAMRLENADLRLAEAQLAVARAYGFASWRRLKSYVDALGNRGRELLDAVREGRVEIIREVLNAHPELVNTTTDLDEPLRPSDTLAMRLIHVAIAENQVEVLRLLIERGADLNVRNADGRLPLHDCFELGHDDFARILLDAGAVPDVCAAAAYGMHERLEQMLASDVKLANDLTTGESPLGWSVYGRQPESARILFRHGAIADRAPYDAKAWRPVSMVAGVLMPRVLMEHGADPNWRDGNGDTPLHRAIKSRLVVDPADFVEVLLGTGADAGARNDAGRTPLDEALAQAEAVAETYFPVRATGPKKLARTIEMLRSIV